MNVFIPTTSNLLLPDFGTDKPMALISEAQTKICKESSLGSAVWKVSSTYALMLVYGYGS